MKTQFAVLRSKGAKFAAAAVTMAVVTLPNIALANADVIAEIESSKTSIVAIGGAILVVLAIVASVAHTRRVVR